MSMFGVSDGFAFHVKALTAEDDGVGLWVRAGSWSSARENLTEGWIPAPVAAALGPAERWEKLVVARLVERDEARGGYQIRNFLRWNPSRADVLARSGDLGTKRSEAGRRGAEARWGKSDGKGNGKPCDADGKGHGKPMAKNAPDPDPDPDPRSSDPLLRAPARVESTPESSPPAEPDRPPALTLGETFAAEAAKPIGELDALARELAAEGNPFGQRCVGYLDGGQALPRAMREKLREILAERAKPRPPVARRTLTVTAEEQALVAVYVAAQKRIRREEVPQLELHALAARRILPDLATLAQSIAAEGFAPTPADVLAHKLETYLRLNDQRLFAEGYPLGLVLVRTDATDLPRPPKRAKPAAPRDGPSGGDAATARAGAEAVLKALREEPRATIRYPGRPGAFDDEQAKTATGS